MMVLDTPSADVVVIDDDDDTRTAIQEALEVEGYQVRGFADGELALLSLEQPPAPKLIILDLMMPGLDGWRFLDEQRHRSDIAEVPVLVLTADRRASQEPGRVPCTVFLPKPVDLDDLLFFVGRLTRAGQ